MLMPLTSEEIKRLNLRILIDEAGGAGKLADKADTNPSYISQILRDKEPRGVGKVLARKLEKAFNRPIGWMDTLHLEYVDGKIVHEELETPIMIKERLLLDYQIRPMNLALIKWSRIDIFFNANVREQEYIPMVIDSSRLDHDLPENAFVVDIDTEQFSDHFPIGTKLIFEPDRRPNPGETMLITFKKNSHKTIVNYRPTPKSVYLEMLEAGYPATIEVEDSDIIIHGVATIETTTRIMIQR